MNSRRYVQRERARRTARTATAIENAALREVARHGYPDLRVTDVARRAHVSTRTVYLHSTSKERLVEQALRRRGAPPRTAPGRERAAQRGALSPSPRA